jgi:glucosamine--fructose-6-phosphate aminotransferase (isomerizing)
VNSIEAMARDMERQLVDLPGMPLPNAATGRIVLAGSGDSYAAALAACHLSSGRAFFCHPADIIADHAIADGARAYFVSISGKTRANILAAKVARKNTTTVAITSDTGSALASACDSTFALGFKSAGKTSGTISFTASLLACARIAADKTCQSDLKTIYKDAARKASSLAGGVGARNLVLLGDHVLHPVAIYGALKFNEVFGSKAVAYPLEDFCHAPVFGHKGDELIIFGSKEDVKVSRRLARAGFKTRYVDCGKYNGLDSILYAAFFVQHLVLSIARRKKVKECYFLRDKKILDASSDIIY